MTSNRDWLPRRSVRRAAFAGALLLLLTAAVYWPVAGFGFVPFDDDTYVYRNPHILGGLSLANIAWSITTLHAGYWIPLTWISLMADAGLWGPWAGGYHLTNVALHAAAALLFFLLLRRILGVTGIPLLAAALFVAHPLHVESVAWVTERKDVLSQALFLLFLHAWLSHLRRPSVKRHTGALVLLALCLMAKPMAFTTPALLLVLDWWPLGRLQRGGLTRLAALVAEKIPAALIGLVFGVLTTIAQQRTGALVTLENYPLSYRAGNAIVTLTQNLGRTLWPTGLSPLYPSPPGGVFPASAIAGALALLAALLAVAFLLRRRQPWLAAGFGWYLIALVPLSGLLQSGVQLTADRFTYLPLIGLHAAAACIAFRVVAAARHPGRGAALLLIPGMLAVPAHRQTLFWHDGVTLFRRAAAVTRDNWFVRNNLGVALYESGRVEEALTQFEAAMRLDSSSLAARRNLGRALGDLGRPDEGAAHLQKVIELDPGNTEARVTLGNLLLKAGRFDKAEQEFGAALAADPASSLALFGMGSLRLEQGRFTETRDLAASAVARNPFDAGAWFLLGTTEARLGAPVEAERHLRRSLTLQPDKADAGYNLALAILEQGRRTEALALLDDLHRRHREDKGIAELREQIAREVR